MLKKIFAIVLSMVMIFTLAACDDKNEEAQTTPETQQTQEAQQDETADTQTEDTENADLYADAIPFTIELENGGVMKGELYPNLAPKTVENFVKLADEDFYDGLIFHRVIKDFMIQGGGYDADMNVKESDEIVGEFSANGFNNPNITIPKIILKIIFLQ